MPRFTCARLAAGMCAALLAAGAAIAQTPAPSRAPTSLEPVHPFLPRTPDDRPDFQGAVWNANFFTYLQATPQMPMLTLPEDRAKSAFEQIMAGFNSLPNADVELPPDPLDGLPVVRGERRTRLLVLPPDGRMPFTPEARAELATPQRTGVTSDNPEDRAYTERCLSQAEPAPRANLFLLGPRQFIQTDTHVVLHTEFGDEAHIIPFADQHRTASPSLMGDSIARWDRDTLVIETTGIGGPGRRRLLPAFIVNPDARVIERYTRLSEAELLYQFTIEDPKVYAAPWLAEYSLFAMPYRMFPFACHEGNRSLPNILRGQRVADERGARGD